MYQETLMSISFGTLSTCKSLLQKWTTRCKLKSLACTFTINCGGATDLGVSDGGVIFGRTGRAIREWHQKVNEAANDICLANPTADYYHQNHYLSLSSSQAPPFVTNHHNHHLSLSSSQPPSVTIIITTSTICHYHHHNQHHRRSTLGKKKMRKKANPRDQPDVDRADVQNSVNNLKSQNWFLTIQQDPGVVSTVWHHVLD